MTEVPLSLSWCAMSASAPRRTPTSARAAKGTARKAARRAAFSASLFMGFSLVAEEDHGRRVLATSRTEREHALHRSQRSLPEVLGQRDLRRAVAHAEIELLQRVEPHVGADAAI